MLLQNPLISIILPVFNAEKYLTRCIEQFIAQDYLNKELIIVDGKSSDNSHDIIEVYTNQYPNIKWVKESDTGISNAFNMGISYCKGEIIGYLGADDLLYKGILETIGYHSSIINFDAIYFDSYSYFINDNKCIYRKTPEHVFTLDNHIKYGTIVGWQNIFFRNYIYDKYRYDENNKTCMDYEFYLKISLEPYIYLYVNKVASVNIFDGNITSIHKEKQYKEATAVAEKYANKNTRESCYPISILNTKRSPIEILKQALFRKHI